MRKRSHIAYTPLKTENTNLAKNNKENIKRVENKVKKWSKLRLPLKWMPSISISFLWNNNIWKYEWKNNKINYLIKPGRWVPWIHVQPICSQITRSSRSDMLVCLLFEVWFWKHSKNIIKNIRSFLTKKNVKKNMKIKFLQFNCIQTMKNKQYFVPIN